MTRAFVLSLGALFLGAAVAAAPSPTGVYSTVSESEWEIELTLTSAHVARLEIATWEPGEGAHPKVERLRGEWQTTSDGVAISFKEGLLNLRFDPKLSFDDFGRKGSAPGFVVTSATLSNWRYAGLNFWLKRELKKLK